MAGLALHLLAYPQVLVGDAPVEMRRRKEVALLAYLVATQRAHSRDTLADLLWPGYDQTSARGNLRRTLSGLNRSLGAGWLTVNRDQVSVPLQDGLWIDVVEFHAFLAECERHGHGSDEVCPRCLVPLQSAAALYAGDFLAGFSLVDAPEFGLWQTLQAENLRRELAGALQRLVRRLAADGDFAEAIVHARRWLELDPLHEPAQRRLMRLYVQCGDRAAAVHQYEECVQALASGLGMQPEPATTALYEQIRSGEAIAHVEPGVITAGAAAQPSHNLPEQPTPFVGRIQELEHIRRRLADPHCRLLTVVGPGGIGKTRLAIQAAHEHLDRFRDGVCFVDLTAVGSAELLAATILHAVAPDEYGDANARRRLREQLHGRQLLLVLDNFEHLLDGADLLPALLHSASGLSLLVTSRQRLNLREEWLEPLDGLEFPEFDGSEPGAFELQAFDATRLFLNCVRRVRPGWQPSQADASAIAGICRMVEGMPLGIELAAAWTRTLPLAEVSGELARGLSILNTSLRDVPARHRSMHAVFHRSWDLLEPSDRSILRQMSVFRGGCTREAAEAVTGARLADLQTLMDSSWLRLRRMGRYDMHELMRQYCEEKLATEHESATGEEPGEVHRRHCEYYAKLLEAPVTKMNFRSDVMEVFVPEFGNVQAGLSWAVEKPYPRAIDPLLVGVWFAGDLLGWQKSVYDLVTAAAMSLESRLDDLAANEIIRNEISMALAVIHMPLAVFSTFFGRLHSTRAHIKRLERLAETMTPGDVRRFYQADIFGKRCLMHWSAGEFEAALRAGHEALARYQDKDFVCPWYGREKGQAFHQADILAAIGYANWYLGDYDEAELCWQRSIALADRIGEQRFRAHHCIQLARLLVTVGRYERAEQLAWEGAQRIREVGDMVWAVLAHQAMGENLCAQGDYTAARSHLLEGVRMWRRSGNQRFLKSLTILGSLELTEGNPVAARTLYAEAMDEFEQSDSEPSVFVAPVWLGLGWTALAGDNLTEAHDMFRTAIASGKCAAWEKMEVLAGLAAVAASEGRVEYAVELLALVVAHPFTAHADREKSQRTLDELAKRIAPDLFAQRVQSGQHRDLDATLTKLTGASDC